MTSDQNPNPAIDLDEIEASIIAILGVDSGTPFNELGAHIAVRIEDGYRTLVRGWDAVPEAERLSPRGKTLRARIMALRSFVYGLKLVASAGPVAAGRRGDVDFLPGIHNLPAPSLPGSSTGRLPPRA